MTDLSLSTLVVAIHTAPTGVLLETHCQPCYLARASRSLQPGPEARRLLGRGCELFATCIGYWVHRLHGLHPNWKQLERFDWNGQFRLLDAESRGRLEASPREVKLFNLVIPSSKIHTISRYLLCCPNTISRCLLYCPTASIAFNHLERAAWRETFEA